MHYNGKIIDESDPFAPVFKISEGLIFRFSRPVGSISIFESDNNKVIQYGEENWILSRDKVGSPSKISEFKYGIPPEGYSESFKAKPLKENKMYTLFFEYGDYAGVLIQFRIVKKDGEYIIEYP